MTKRYAVFLVALIFALGTGAGAQSQTAAQKAAAEKAAAEKAMDEARKQSVETAAAMAEATARAQQKVLQEQQKQAEEAARRDNARLTEVIPIDIEVVISRYQADKKVSSLPYAITVNASGPQGVEVGRAPVTQIRMGGQVPIPTMAPALGPDGKPVAGFTGGGPVAYKDVGTSIDARSHAMGDGRFEVWVSVQEDAIATPQGATQTNSLPVIRTFRAANNIVLKDGQTRQFTAAADRITGEVVKVDVTLKVAK